jgi:hypothetical protein
LSLDPVRGAVSTVTSHAENISVLGGILRFGEVRASATAWAHGRPGTSGTDYKPVIKRVSLAGQELCSDTCSTQVIDTINQQLAGRVRVSVPVPGRLASNGGYQATVARRSADQIEEIVLNEQPNDRLELPAMVITVYGDAAKPARTVVELAGAEVEARYGITALSSRFDDIDDPGSGALSSIIGSDLAGGSGPSPFFGLPPGEQPFGASPVGISNSDGTGTPASALSTAGRLIWNGLRSLKLVPVWAFLLVPIYLSARRWLLLQRTRLLAGGP